MPQPPPVKGPTFYSWIIMILMVILSCLVCIAFFRACMVEVKKAADRTITFRGVL